MSTTNQAQWRTHAEETRILVVDDNPATLYSTSRVLRNAGWTVIQADSGTQAVEYSVRDIDLVVLDINLPDFDGFEVCRRLRSNEVTQRVPVVHLSATFTREMDKVHGLESGADGYLTHPVEPPVLIATINAFLRARRAEAELRESESRFKVVFESAINGILLLDEQWQFKDLNPAMATLIGVSRDDLLNRALRDFIPGNSIANLKTAIGELVSGGAWRGALPMRRPDGQLIHLEWSVSKYTDPAGWLAIVSDISARVRYENEREQLLDSERSARTQAENANRLKDDFLATLSHELRTPLNAIVGWSELLKTGALAPADAKEGIEAIERNAKAQAQLISDLLDVARINSGKMRLDVELVDFPATVSDSLTTIAAAAAAKEIRLLQVLDPQVGVVSADPARLQQIVWNLVSNAVKFTPKGGLIRVSLTKVGSHAELIVADSGVGISAENLPVVFDRFRQIDASTTRSHGGLGLGLAIVRQLVELHGGTIRAESAGENLGAAFVVRLPLASLASTRHNGDSYTQTKDTHHSTISLDALRILVVDDDEDARRLTKMVLSDAGAVVETASTVESALALIDEFCPAVLISDIGMPGRDGFDLIRTVRSKGITPQKLPALALTAFARTDDRRRLLMSGFQLHLAKPADPRELAASVASLASRAN